MRGHDSPDRRQWIKSGPKSRAGTRRGAYAPDRKPAARRRDPVAPRPKPPAHFAKKRIPQIGIGRRPGRQLGQEKSGAALGTPRQWIKSGPKNESEHTTMPSAACVAVMRSTAVVVSFIMPWQPYSPGQRCGRLFIADAMYG